MGQWADTAIRDNTIAIFLGGLGLAFVAFLGHRVWKLMLKELREAIRDVTTDDIQSLKDGQAELRAEFSSMRTENAEQHAEVTRRLDALEKRTP